MSTKNHYRTMSAIVVFVLAALVVASAQDDSDDVLMYYTDNARRSIEGRNPLAVGTVYVLRTMSYYKYVGQRGIINRTDSAEIDFYYSWGQLDSQKTVSGDPDRFEGVTLDWPNVFDEPYHFNLFPNDTGGEELGIGFDTDSLGDPLPVGLAIVDRTQFYPRWLYLFYQTMDGHTRYSRSLRFVEREGLVFVDSVWIVGSRESVFSSEHYRLETGVTEITIQP